MKIHPQHYALAAVGVLALLLAGFLAYGWVQYGNLKAELGSVQQEYASTTDDLKSTIIELEGTLALANDENATLSETLEAEQKKNALFEKRISGIAETVETLDKLAKTDPQLLQKYSKVYFLNEHYAPPELVDIDPSFLYNKESKQQFHAKVWPNLENLIEEAAEDGINLKIVSAYRSFGAQASLKNAYSVTYGTGANTFSADQGYSEHQLGTTIDFTSASSTPFSGFDKTEAYAWLQENAHRFGFILSYPPNNAYYVYEPWHWRFVGEQLARHLHREEKYFYDVDQREINEYLVSFFE